MSEAEQLKPPDILYNRLNKVLNIHGSAGDCSVREVVGVLELLKHEILMQWWEGEDE
jgi:hypothetical protein